jgi:gentisate 1,2-dioxygenase
MNENNEFRFVDCLDAPHQRSEALEPIVIKKKVIDEEIVRLANLPAPVNGRRMSLVCNPHSGIGNGLTPGIAVAICVLKPGEQTKPLRHNSSLVNFCIQGEGSTIIDGRRLNYHQFDVWTTPPWSTYQHFNDTAEDQVRLTYSNSPLLEKLGVHIVDEIPEMEETGTSQADNEPKDGSKISPYGTFRLTEDGAFLMPYEKLIDPPSIELKPLQWPWQSVKQELDKLRALGQQYVGRRLYLLYDPATGRTNGTTSSFFATITIRPGNIVDRPHRHVSAAINYYFAGSGYSTVEGKRHEWEAGDLMLSAPGWAVHNHASNEQDVYELTVQDQPLHIALGSLLWQESLREKPRLLGIQNGFATNRVKAVETTGY